jgi:hypothetical protein
MPTWFWLNIPAAVVAFSATAGIPLWMVLRRPDQKPDLRHRPPAGTPQPAPSQPRHERERELQLTH